MSDQIRRPGEDFLLTDEELLNSPVKMLSRTQRRRRRQLKNNRDKQTTRARRADRKKRGGAKIKFCMGQRKDGEDCSRYALTGAKHCVAHLTEDEKKRLGKQNKPDGHGFEKNVSPGRPQTSANAPLMIKQVVESAVEKLVRRYFAALGIEFVGFDEEGQPVIVDHGFSKGLKLHGESKEGTIHMSQYPDLVAQIAVIEKLIDRTYGKPRQTQVIEGGIQPIKVQPVRSPERAKEVAALLGRTGAIPHEGRQRREPAKAVETAPASNVSPIRREDS